MRVRRREAGGEIWVGRLCLSFQRIRADGAGPALGAIPVHRVAAFPRARALGWPSTACLIHLPDGEALWLGLGASTAGPTAIRVRFEGVDAVAGTPWAPRLSAAPQNYVVWPDQLRIEGVYRNARLATRFSLGTDPWRVLDLSLFAPRGRGSHPPARSRPRARPILPPIPPVMHAPGGDAEAAAPDAVIPDRTGRRWRVTPEATVRVYVATPRTYRELTGLEPLAEVTEGQAYRGHRLP